MAERKERAPIKNKNGRGAERVCSVLLMNRIPGWHQRRRGERGATALEFAMIAPFYFLLLIGTIETSMVMFAQHVLENASATASRTGKTGYVSPTLNQQQTIMAAVDRMAGFLMDKNKIAVSSKAYKSFSGIGTGEQFVDANMNNHWDPGENYTDSNGNGQYDTDIGTTGYGTAGDIVVYTITYPWPIMTPAMQHFLGEDGILNLRSRIVVKNEPF